MKKNDADILDFIAKIYQQLVLLDKKVDALIAKTALVPKPVDVKTSFASSRPFQQQSNAHARAQRQNERFRERIMYKTVCADCRKSCEVPFRPTGDRPVYCQECFSRRKNNSFKPNINNLPRPSVRIPTANINRLQPVEKKKSFIKRKPVMAKPPVFKKIKKGK